MLWACSRGSVLHSLAPCQHLVPDMTPGALGEPGAPKCSLTQVAKSYTFQKVRIQLPSKHSTQLHQIHACGPLRALDKWELILPLLAIPCYLQKSEIQFISGSIHSFNKYLLSTFQEPDTVQVLRAHDWPFTPHPTSNKNMMQLTINARRGQLRSSRRNASSRSEGGRSFCQEPGVE